MALRSSRCRPSTLLRTLHDLSLVAIDTLRGLLYTNVHFMRPALIKPNRKSRIPIQEPLMSTTATVNFEPKTMDSPSPPPPLSPSQKLPPSARDFLIFERLIVEHSSTRAAAAEIGLS